MVKKVVPLPEDVLTVFEVALHQLDPPVRSRVLEAHYSEASCPRHVVTIYSDLADVDLTPVFNEDGHSAGDHILKGLQFYLARVARE